MPATSFTSELKLINKTLESKLDGLNASLDARLNTYNSEIRILRWMIVIGVAIIATIGFFG